MDAPTHQMHAATQALRCLIVEDNAFARNTLSKMLQSLGHTVYVAADGKTAISVCESTRPEIVFLDLALPDMAGEEVLEQLLARQPSLMVIVVSGSGDLSSPISAFRKGAVDYIPKNLLTVEALRLTLRHCLERQTLENEIKAAGLRHKRLIENVPLVIFTLNEQMELTYVSKAVYQVLGFSPEDIVASPGWFLNSIHADDRGNVQALLLEAFASAGNESVFCEFRFLRTQHASLFLQLRGSISEWTDIHTGLQIRQMEGALLDLSERVFLEQLLVQREKLNTLASLVDEVAHEFLNPVFALAGFARILQRKYPDAQETGVILEEAKRLETMIARVQEYLMPVEVSLAPCKLADLVRFVADTMRTQLMQRGVELELEIEDVPPVESDMNILTQIIVGMFSMASQWAEPRSTVHAHCRSLAKGKGLEFNVVMTAPNIVDRDPELSLIPFAHGGKPQPLVLGYKLARTLGCLLSLRHEKDKLIATLHIPMMAKR